ncbi:MAG: LysM peptidoglycan-binding domain-containing protein [Spirochaetia bacterium]|nr:LysM peptidoglycan-binding domain-containing protein [Spirochaetia bacterium]
MKKSMSMLLALVFSVTLAFFSGCGGGGQQVNSAADEEGQVMDEASQQKKEELPTTYMVEDGDTLYSIAEKAEIYGNKYQWPLIYDANRDILDDYRTVTEGQKLIIPRNVSAVEIEAAKQRAQELGWPSKGAVRKAVAAVEEEEDTEDSLVAGMGSRADSDESASETGETDMTEAGAEENPTPIPETKAKVKKKGGMNMMLLLLILLGVLAVILVIYKSQKKKNDDDEEEDNKDDKSDNILG